MKSHQASQNAIKKWSNHIVPIQPDKCINPEAAPVTALKVELREGPIKRRLALGRAACDAL